MKKLTFILGLMLLSLGDCLCKTDTKAAAQKTVAKPKPTAKTEIKPAEQEIAEIIQQIEKYFNSITTFEADFVQTDAYGRESFGHFYMKMPSMMKMDYIDPPTHVMIACANKIVHYDRELEEKDEIPLSASPLSFLLKRNVNFKRFRIKILKNEEDVLIIRLSRQNADGAITLVFSKNPFLLREWFIIEDIRRPQNFVQITLFNWRYGQPIDDAEFKKFSSHGHNDQIKRQ